MNRGSNSDSSSCADRSFPDEVLGKILSLDIFSNHDRNSFSLVNKTWYEAERWTRQDVFVRNCYPVCPHVVTRRFTRVTSVTLQGYIGYFKSLPQDWRRNGNNAGPWLDMFAKFYPFLEKLRLVSVKVDDESLKRMAKSFPDLKVLSLSSCYGFSGDGAIAGHCKVENDQQEYFPGYDVVFEHLDAMGLQEHPDTSNEEDICRWAKFLMKPVRPEFIWSRSIQSPFQRFKLQHKINARSHARRR